MSRLRTRKGISWLIAVIRINIERWQYKRAKLASREPLDPRHMQHTYGQPITDKTS